MRLVDKPLETTYGKRTRLGVAFLAATRWEKYGKGYRSEAHIVAKCVCGSVDVVKVVNFKAGQGCKQCQHEDHKTHGRSRDGGCNSLSKVYMTWSHMRRRVLNRDGRHPTYTHVDIDPRWDETFEAFYSDMGEPPTTNHTLERTDNKKGYWSWNCRWATRKDQARNLSTNRLIEYRGVTRCMAEWAEILGMKYGTLKSRLCDYNWSVERAFTEAVVSR